MKNYTKIWLLCLLANVFCQSGVFAQNAPGEDPITLLKQTKFDARPTAASPQSTGLDPLFGLPGWLHARVSRYEARAYSDVVGNVLTDNDVVTTASAQGLKKVCVQEVGSTASDTTGFGKYGPKGAPQIVVLKGDLVNICK
jgi:hypothetical protein